ncbi:MAG: asparaginase domain-containing protein [Candidatus Daviesbacteria bacterium]|nr:asparaginase domain-containing protein [Candidatus Daviesbacteria bacterium]
MTQSPEKPRICFITTPGEITQLKSGYGDPRQISPGLINIADVAVVRMDKARFVDPKTVAEAVYSRLDRYDGFVVTAGKEDLQILAPRLSFALGPNLDKTVAVTSSNIPASFVHSGARERLVRAAMVAGAPFKEVVIAFDELAVRGTSSQVGFKGSVNLLAYNSYYEDGHLGKITALGLEINHVRKSESGIVNLLPDINNNVVSFGITPGTEPELIEPLTEGKSGVIFSTDGKALPSQDPYSLFPLARRLIEKGIPILVANTVRDATLGIQAHYMEESAVEELGGIVVRNMNFMVATTKFCWVLSRVAEEVANGKIPLERKIARVKQWMETPYVGEFGIRRPFNAIQA